ncbi:MAG: hypothetical protein HKM02_00110 [Pseudomonadales bacterium]|nr:hypothetical protein [Pseudomonadales bacterium]
MRFSVVLRYLLILLLTTLLAACAITSVFDPYPQQARTWRNDIRSGNYPEAQALLDKKRHDADGILYLMERGRIDMLAHDTASSLTDFADVIARWEQLDQRARVSLSESAAEGASLLTNDNALPYEGEIYEKVFVHQYQALNYLSQGRPQDALVEVRQAEFIQRQALLAHDNQVYAAENKARRQGFNPASFNNYFSGMNMAAGRVKNAFQNAYCFYVSALIYEAEGQLNDAYIDDKKALEIWPDNDAVRLDVLRLGSILGMSEVAHDAAQVKNLIPAPQYGSLVILFEQGFVPEKTEIKLPIITNNTTNFIAVPYYSGPFPLPQQIDFVVDDQSYIASPIVDVSALAVSSLKGHLPALLARQWLRLLSKQKMQRELSNQAGSLGSIAGMIYNLVSEQADLRSWTTLPASAQVSRVWAAAGLHTVQIAGVATQVPVRAGHTTILQVLDAGGRRSISQYSL